MADTRSHGPLRIGLTGGIASGKSTVAAMFEALGIPVIDTDVIARELVRPGQPALEEIRGRFGGAVIDADGCLDRGRMRTVIFADDAARRDLEGILHPRIGAETRRRSAEADGPYQLIVVPLLVGSPLRDFVDRVLVVDCDEDTQVRRLVARDTETVEQARRILAAQARRDERLAIADDVLSSDSDLATMQENVTRLDREYRRLAAAASPRARFPGSS